MPESKKAIYLSILTAIIAISGTIFVEAIRGINEINLEREKFQSKLIFKALEEKNVEQRKEFIEFLVETNLISNRDIRIGLEQYWKSDTTKAPPYINKTESVARCVENEVCALSIYQRAPDLIIGFEKSRYLPGNFSVQVCLNGAVDCYHVDTLTCSDSTCDSSLGAAIHVQDRTIKIEYDELLSIGDTVRLFRMWGEKRG